MLRLRFQAALCFSLLAATALAQSEEKWTPSSDNAMSLGTVRFTMTKLTMGDGSSLRLRRTGSVRYTTDWGATVQATVYEVITPAVPGKSADLCGGKPVAFVLTSRPPPVGSDVEPRELDAFEGNRFAFNAADFCVRVSFDAAKH